MVENVLKTYLSKSSNTTILKYSITSKAPALKITSKSTEVGKCT